MKLLYWVFGLFITSAVIGGLIGLYHGGQTSGQAVCVATQAIAVQQGEAVQKAATQVVIHRASATGTKQERDRVAVNQFFNQLEKEQDHAPADPVDACVLPAERLRLWRDANAGRTTQGATPAQLDRAAPAVTAPGLGATAGLGIKPPRDSAGLSPAGPADVQPAGLSGDQP